MVAKYECRKLYDIRGAVVPLLQGSRLYLNAKTLSDVEWDSMVDSFQHQMVQKSLDSQQRRHAICMALKYLRRVTFVEDVMR